MDNNKNIELINEGLKWFPGFPICSRVSRQKRSHMCVQLLTSDVLSQGIGQGVSPTLFSNNNKNKSFEYNFAPTSHASRMCKTHPVEGAHAFTFG